ncbi:MAG: asparagine synthase-related protein, partial [Bacteroides sp.]|nr:asparagine synthase-related protein [Bacteroides sp.]
IQYRYPLLDKRVVEFMLKIPSDHLFIESFGRVLLREATGDRLPEEVKWSTSKTDPVLTKHLDDLSTKIFKDMLSQLEEFRENPALDFFDFGKFEKALAKASLGKPPGQDISLRHVFFRLKWIHEFTRKYAQ